MDHKQMLIELVVKSTIIFICIGFIIVRFSSYVIDEFGTVGYVIFVLSLNLGGFLGFTKYYKHRVRRHAYIDLFNTYYDKCISSYEKCKSDIDADDKIFFSNPFSLISSLGLHEFIINTYVAGKESEEFNRLKHSVLLAVCEKDNSKVIENVDKLLKLFVSSKFKYKIKVK